VSERRSAVGSYAGYSEPVANGYVRRSEYVRVRDGCMLAIDVLHPARNGEPLKGPRPTVLRATGYRRSFRRGEKIFYDISRLPFIERHPVGAIITPYEFAPAITRLVNHGYVVASLDLRGTGASFGSYDVPVTVESGRDVADILDWIAAQSWCNGNIGMWGRSWEAAVQLTTAVVGSKALKCICPMAMGGTLDATWFNGLFPVGFLWGYTALRKGQDEDEQALPVDGPDGLAMLQEANASRTKVPSIDSMDALGEFGASGWITDAWAAKSVALGEPILPETGRPPQIQENFRRFNASGIPVYWFQGWWDLTFINTALSQFADLTLPKKLLVGPWTHSQYAIEHEPLRWFDYWLKDIDNGIMAEPQAIYATTSIDGAIAWKEARRELFGREKTRFYLNNPPGSDPRSSGTLTPDKPTTSIMSYEARYDVSTGPQTRTTYLYVSTQMKYPSLNERVGKVLTLTSAPLGEAVELTGVPTLELNLSTSVAGGAVFATLEQVKPDGHSFYLSEALLNLAYRRVLNPTYGYIGEALHPAFPDQQEVVIPNTSMKLALDFFAISVRIEEGDRLRLSLAAADHGNYHVKRDHPPAQWRIALGGDNAAVLKLPLIKGAEIGAPLLGLFEDDAAPYAFEQEAPT
jgi:putative CocE/NonD family hydrolase